MTDRRTGSFFFSGMEVALGGWKPVYKKYVRALVDFRLPCGALLRDCAYRFRRNVRDVLPCQVQIGAHEYRQLLTFEDAKMAEAFHQEALAAIDRYTCMNAEGVREEDDDGGDS